MANTKTGRVVSKSGDQTIAVLVVTYKNHPVYKKRYIYSKKYLVHDPQNKAKKEDTVVIKQSRPISRRKRWILENIVNQSAAPVNVKAEIKEVASQAVEAETTKKPLKTKTTAKITKKPLKTKTTAKTKTPLKSAKKTASKVIPKASSKTAPKKTVSNNKKKETEK